MIDPTKRRLLRPAAPVYILLWEAVEGKVKVRTMSGIGTAELAGWNMEALCVDWTVRTT